MIRRLCSNNHKLDESSKSKSNDNAFDEHFDRRHKSFDNKNCNIDGVIKFIHKSFATILKASKNEMVEGIHNDKLQTFELFLQSNNFHSIKTHSKHNS